MNYHRQRKFIGGGVFLLIALTGVVANASGAAIPTPNTSAYIETKDTADQIQSPDIALEVETPSTPNNKNALTQPDTRSCTSSEHAQSEESTASELLWDGPILNSFAGIIQGPSGSETYYNLEMSGVVSIMKDLGYDYSYWVRDDGVKMYGDYVMCAADLSIKPRGTIIETSLGKGIVCDTGGFVSIDPTRLDIAVTW